MRDDRKIVVVTKSGVIYARVSSQEQEREGFSIPAQLDLLRRYAADHGITVTKEFTDVETAKRAGRGGFQDMIYFLKENPSSTIILVEKTDRLYRNIKDWVTLDPEDLGVELHFVKEGQIISRTSRSSEKFVHGIKVLMAKNYVDNLSEEVRKGLLRKAEEGLYPTHAPIGFLDVIRPDGKRGIQPDPEIAPTVRRLFERAATGLYTLRELTKWARGEGLKSQFGKPVNAEGVRRILHNVVYTDRFLWAGKIYFHKGFDPVIPYALYEKVQEIISRYKGKAHPRNVGVKAEYKKLVHTLPFSGLLKCGHCGGALIGEIQKGHLKRRDYIYYRCAKKCEKYIREERIDEQFANQLRRLHFSEETYKLLVDAMKGSFEDEQRYRDEALTRLRCEYDRVKGLLDKLADEFLQGTFDKKFYEKKRDELRLEQDRITVELDAYAKADRDYVDDGIALLDLARRSHELYAKQKGFDRKKLLGFVLSNPLWRDGEIAAEFRKPFDLIALTAQRAKEEMSATGCAEHETQAWLGD